MKRDAAEAFAARLLAWMAEDAGRIGAFLDWSGESPATLSARINDPDLLLAVIDFLMLDEAQLLEACSALGLPPETPMRARAALPGGDDPHWT